MPQQAKIEADTGNVIVTVLAPLPEKDDLPHCLTTNSDNADGKFS